MNPSDIIVRNRQRRAEIDDTFVSSIRRRLIHPIVIRQSDEGPILVVGERRLQALKTIGINPLVENVHFRFFEDLSPEEAEIVELEENVKRSDIPWRDHVRAVTKIYKIYSKQGLVKAKIAEELSITKRHLDSILLVGRNIDSSMLKDANGISHAYSLLQVAADRAAAEAVGQISQAGRDLATNKPENGNKNETSINNTDTIRSVSDVGSDILGDTENQQEFRDPGRNNPSQAANPIDCISFFDWVADYSGPKFNVIHCDFPYNVDYRSYAASTNNTDEDYDPQGFDKLLNAFCGSLDKFCSYSAHIIFWFSMDFYEATKQQLRSAGLFVHDKPLIWYKSDNAGIIPGQNNQYPRHIYETAFLCSRGKRPLIKSLGDCYPCPTVSSAIHPSQKPEPMLKHFMSMLVDETTDVFDPTAGSGAALRAADALGARRIYGLEISPSYAERANSATLAARNLRRVII